MPNIGWTELIIVIFLVLLLFGANKLPDLARSMGRSARIFKSEVKEMKNDDAAGQPEQAQPQRELDATPGGSNGITNSDAQQAARPESFWDKPENQRNQ